MSKDELPEWIEELEKLLKDNKDKNPAKNEI